MTKSRCARAFFLAVFPVLAWAADDDLAVVVNKDNPVDNLTKAQLRKMILGEQGQWASGKKVAVLLRSSGSDRDAVLKSICSMSSLEFEQYLVHASFNGESGGAPKSLASGVAIRLLIISVPGAIGFLHISEVNDSVKVVKFEGVAAGGAGYKLKVN
jgi:phosphate transport system substrate-binding protein